MITLAASVDNPRSVGLTLLFTALAVIFVAAFRKK